jgi:hypothetical protein
MFGRYLKDHPPEQRQGYEAFQRRKEAENRQLSKGKQGA